MFFYHGLVKRNRLLVLWFLHEQHMCHIQLPRFIFTAKLDGLSKYLLHHRVVFLIPEDFRLSHEHRYVSENWLNESTKAQPGHSAFMIGSKLTSQSTYRSRQQTYQYFRGCWSVEILGLAWWSNEVARYTSRSFHLILQTPRREMFWWAKVLVQIHSHPKSFSTQHHWMNLHHQTTRILAYTGSNNSATFDSYAARRSAAKSKWSYLMERRRRLRKVSGGHASLSMRKQSFSNPPVASLFIRNRAILCRVTASSSDSNRGGMSVKASKAAGTNKMSAESHKTNNF